MEYREYELLPKTRAVLTTGANPESISPDIRRMWSGIMKRYPMIS